MLKASSFPPSMAARDGKDCDMDGTTPESRTQCRSPRKRVSDLSLNLDLNLRDSKLVFVAVKKPKNDLL